jgi:proline-specific peptidase
MSQEGYVGVEGGRISYVVVGGGDATPLLCLHGGPGLPHDYLEPLGDLVNGRRVVFYDQLGCGRSDRPGDERLWRVDRFVDEIDAVRHRLGLESIHLLGHSWGGFLAATYAMAQSEGLRSLVLASPLISVDRWLQDAASLRSMLPADVQEVLNRHESDGFTDCPEYVAATLAYYKRHFCRIDPWPEPLERTWAGMGLDVYVTMWGPTEFYATGSLRGYNLTERLAQIELPTLLTCGRYDEARPDTVAAFAERIPRSEVAMFEDSSHTLHLEDPDRYVGAVSAFLARVDN